MSDKKCPTCGECDWGTGVLGHTTCQECGTMITLHNGEAVFVPRRAKPPEVVELPTGEGPWWRWSDELQKYFVHDIYMASSDRPYIGTTSCTPGKYIRATPPPPPVERDADAGIELLRAAYDAKDDLLFDRSLRCLRDRLARLEGCEKGGA